MSITTAQAIQRLKWMENEIDLLQRAVLIYEDRGNCHLRAQMFALLYPEA